MCKHEPLQLNASLAAALGCRASVQNSTKSTVLASTTGQQHSDRLHLLWQQAAVALPEPLPALPPMPLPEEVPLIDDGTLFQDEDTLPIEVLHSGVARFPTKLHSIPTEVAVLSGTPQAVGNDFPAGRTCRSSASMPWAGKRI